MGCPPVRGDNPRASASGLSYVQVDKHGITAITRSDRDFEMSSVILLPEHPASFAHKFLFQRVPASPGMQ